MFSLSPSAFSNVNPLHTARSLILEGEALYMKFQNKKSFEKFEQAYHILKETGLKEESVKKYYQEIIMRLLSMEIQNTTSEERYKHFCDLFWSEPNLVFDDLFLNPNLQNEFETSRLRYQQELQNDQKNSHKKNSHTDTEKKKKELLLQVELQPQIVAKNRDMPAPQSLTPWYRQKWFYYTSAIVLTAGLGGTGFFIYKTQNAEKTAAF